MFQLAQQYERARWVVPNEGTAVGVFSLCSVSESWDAIGREPAMSYGKEKCCMAGSVDYAYS